MWTVPVAPPTHFLFAHFSIRQELGGVIQDGVGLIELQCSSEQSSAQSCDSGVEQCLMMERPAATPLQHVC